MSGAVRVAYQGERGAFSEVACGKLLGEEAQTIPFRSFEEMFEAVADGEADCCVTPIENSLAGSIHRNYDLLLASEMVIFGETNLRIVHNLIAAPGTPLAAIERVYSHPVALAQCGHFLRAHPQMEGITMHDTAGAVRVIMDRREPAEAAIASEAAARLYGGEILATNIEDDPQNYTRFFLLAPQGKPIEPIVEAGSSRWKTSLLIQIANKPASLFHALGVLARAEIDLSKIESRPIPGKPWEYAFYIDIIGNVADAPVAHALQQLREVCDVMTMLGCYPTNS
ncbi:MAG: prephenate dehydratase [Thermoanaerobaculia bacterium]